MSDHKSVEPQGILAIMTSPEGDVVATAMDFNRSGMGGCKLWEAQKWRAQDQVKWATVRAYCSDVVSSGISSYTSTKIADELCQKGHKITFRAIGYPEDIAAAVAHPLKEGYVMTVAVSWRLDMRHMPLVLAAIIMPSCAAIVIASGIALSASHASTDDVTIATAYSCAFVSGQYSIMNGLPSLFPPQQMPTESSCAKYREIAAKHGFKS